MLTVPTGFGVVAGEEYKASKLADGTIIYEPTTHTNIFATKEARDYDFQADVQKQSWIATSWPPLDWND